MAVELWMATAVANVVLVGIYGTIAGIMLIGLYRGKQWFTNPLATATAAIFITCTIGHGVHVEHVVLPALGIHDEVSAAARLALSDWRLLAWDGFTAGIAIWYFTLRSRLQLMFKGAALCEDLEARHKQAQQLHDNVVQGLVQAKLALDLGRRDEGARAISETLDSAKAIITGLIGPQPSAPLQPGDLRRERGA